MKTKITSILFLVSISIYCQNCAYIHQDSILASLPNYKMNMIKIDSISKVYQNEIKTAKEEWNSKLADLLKPYNVKEKETIDIIKKRMTAIDTSKLSIMIDEDKLLNKRAQNYDLMLSTLYKSDVQPLLDKVNSAVETYAKTNKIDIVYILEQLRPALAYVDRRKNITKKIIDKIK